MRFVVKNTTKWGVWDLLCPHSCRGCGRLGAVLCECCRNDILKRQKAICPICRLVIADKYKSGKGCQNCKSKFEQIFVVGWREGPMSQIVSEFKYQSVRACGDVLADLIDQTLPKDLEEMVIVPLPTIGKHVRARGLDHTEMLAKKLARRRGWRHQALLGRKTDSVQVGAKAQARHDQAKKTYELIGKISPNTSYLLLDDVWTTGATMQAAAEIMKKAGAKRLFAVVVETGKAKN